MKLLLAEDEKDMAAALVAVLEHSGYEVDAVRDGRAALALAHKGTYACMVFDVMMPVMDGVTALKELRAAGAEAISVNGQRLTGTSEIRCAGPTLSVNNVRSSAPFEIRAIGDKKSLENSLRMRGGVAETLGVWGIQLDITVSDDVYIPPYRGSIRQNYAHETEEREEGSK